MDMSLNIVIPNVYVNREKIQCETIRLEQTVNEIHNFEVTFALRSSTELWKLDPEKIMEYVGQEAFIEFTHASSKESCEFSGYVTNVEFGSWNDGYGYRPHESNLVHLFGHGRVIKLDEARGMDSFCDMTLKSIFSEVVQSAQDAASSVVCNPKFTGVLPYVARYNETPWRFLNRLSSTFSELFYYDGKNLNFGVPNDQQTVRLTFQQDLISLRTIASGKQRNMSRYGYIPADDSTYWTSSDPRPLPGLLRNVDKLSASLFDPAKKSFVAGEYPVANEQQMKEILKSRQSSLDGSMLSVEGVTRTSRLKLGGLVELIFPDGMGVRSLGKYRIMELVHVVDDTGNYSNFFKASPVGFESIPSFEPRVAYPEVGYVTSNDDPQQMGRVQVQLGWQGPLGKNTNWVRVQSPDAGGSGMKNRGLVFVPEVGDMVMVGYVNGDPNRPYVSGSMFTGKNGAGGGTDNNIHSIVTKSGHKLVFNDEKGDKWGLSITDGNGNSISFAACNDEISVTAKDTINLSAKRIQLMAEQISLDASDSISLYSENGVTADANGSMALMAGEDMSMLGKNITVDASESAQYHSDKMKQMADSEMAIESKKVEVNSSSENLVLASGGDIDAQSKGKINLF